jgi:hypothetical protein
MTIETAEIMVHPVLNEIRLLSNIGHLEKKYSSQHGGPRMPDRAVLNLKD